MIISIFASIWAENLWDELILKNEIEILRQRYSEKNPKFIVFSYDIKNPFYTSEDTEYKEYFPIWSKNLKNIFRNVINFFIFLYVSLKSDLIVIGWGGIIYDTEKQSTRSPLDSWLFRTNIFRLFFKKFSFLGLGISIDESNNESINKVKKIFSKATSIEVRDDYSHNLLSKLWIESEIILDPVFYDNKEAKINRNLCLKKLDSKNFKLDDLKYIDFSWKKVWLAFRRGYFSKSENPQIEIYIIKELIEYLQSKKAKVILLPHSFHKTDILANDFEWMKLILGKVENVEITTSMFDTYEVYKDKKIDICMAERFHSIILSNVYDIPFVAFSYSKKTFEVLKEF